jgi:hypothetical protein
VVIPIIDAAFKVLDRVLPDAKQKAEAQLKLLEMQQAGEFKLLEADLQIALAQADINKTEAADPSVFKSGWRPAVGWVCVSGLAYTFIGQPLLSWASGVWQIPNPPPLDMGDLFTLLAGMLGLGGSERSRSSRKSPEHRPPTALAGSKWRDGNTVQTGHDAT